MAARALCCEINIVAFSMSEPDVFFYYIHCIVVVLEKVFKKYYGPYYLLYEGGWGPGVIIFHNAINFHEPILSIEKSILC